MSADNVSPLRPEPADAMGRWNQLALRQDNELRALAANAPDFSTPELSRPSLLSSLFDGLTGSRHEPEVGG